MKLPFSQPRKPSTRQARARLNETPMSDDTSEGRKALAAVQAAWNSAGKDWNPEALTAVYTADALFFGGRPGHSVGANPIREYFASYVGVIESGSMELVDQQIARLAAECFLAQGYGEF